jgi:hypothetical protein
MRADSGGYGRDDLRALAQRVEVRKDGERGDSPYCRGIDLVAPCMKACISSRVRRPSLLASIALKIRS